MNRLDTQPLVYVVILNFNGFKDTNECIFSVLKATYVNIRIIVIDNLSTDGSIGSITSFFNENNLLYTHFKSLDEAFNCPSNNNKITLIEAGENKGYGHGNNVGIKFALKNKADYIAVLNNDTLVDSDFIEPLVKACQEDENIGIASGMIYFYPEVNRIWYAGGSYSKITMTTKHFNYNLICPKEKESLDVSFVSGCFWFIPASVFDAVGLINENYFMYVEDVEFCHRALSAGFKLKYISDSVIYHKVGASSGRNSEFSVYWTSKNTIRFIFECLPRRYLLISLPYYIVRKSLSCFRCFDFAALKAHLKGVFVQLKQYVIDGIC